MHEFLLVMLPGQGLQILRSHISTQWRASADAGSSRGVAVSWSSFMVICCEDGARFGLTDNLLGPVAKYAVESVWLPFNPVFAFRSLFE